VGAPAICGRVGGDAGGDPAALEGVGHHRRAAVAFAQQLRRRGPSASMSRSRARARLSRLLRRGPRGRGGEVEERVGLGAGDGIGLAQARRQGHRDDFAEGMLVVAGGEFDQGQPVGGQGRGFALDGDDRLEALDRQIGGVGQGDDQAGLLATPEGHPHAAPEIPGRDVFCRVIKALGQRNGKRDADDGGAHGRFRELFAILIKSVTYKVLIRPKIGNTLKPLGARVFSLSTKSVDNFVGNVGKASQNPLPASLPLLCLIPGQKYIV
jgi:hypothetical protein